MKEEDAQRMGKTVDRVGKRKEEDAQRMGKTVDRVGKRTILRQCVEQETNRLIIKIKEV
jgi:hypothetical protein